MKIKKRAKQKVFVVVRYTQLLDLDECSVDKVFADRDIAEQYAIGRSTGRVSYHVLTRSVQGRVK